MLRAPAQTTTRRRTRSRVSCGRPRGRVVEPTSHEVLGRPIRRSGRPAVKSSQLWLMLLLGLGGAIELALIITVVRTRMWLVLRV